MNYLNINSNLRRKSVLQFRHDWQLLYLHNKKLSNNDWHFFTKNSFSQAFEERIE